MSGEEERGHDELERTDAHRAWLSMSEPEGDVEGAGDEILPGRPQREVDLEAFDLQRRGYSIRQIAKIQEVHPATAFHRVARGREIDAREPLRAEGESLHAEVAKLRQLEESLFPDAVAGDKVALRTVLHIWERLWKIGRFAREQEKAAENRADREGINLMRGMHPPVGARPQVPLSENLPPHLSDDNDEWFTWEMIEGLLPERAAEIAALKKEYAAAIVEDEARAEAAEASPPAMLLAAAQRLQLPRDNADDGGEE